MGIRPAQTGPFAKRGGCCFVDRNGSEAESPAIRWLPKIDDDGPTKQGLKARLVDKYDWPYSKSILIGGETMRPKILFAVISLVLVQYESNSWASKKKQSRLGY